MKLPIIAALCAAALTSACAPERPPAPLAPAPMVLHPVAVSQSTNQLPQETVSGSLMLPTEQEYLQSSRGDANQPAVCRELRGGCSTIFMGGLAEIMSDNYTVKIRPTYWPGGRFSQDLFYAGNHPVGGTGADPVNQMWVAPDGSYALWDLRRSECPVGQACWGNVRDTHGGERGWSQQGNSRLGNPRQIIAEGRYIHCADGITWATKEVAPGIFRFVWMPCHHAPTQRR